jgi:hypothetical protein
MKRDYDLIRTILLRAEEVDDYQLHAKHFVTPEHTEIDVARHFQLLDEAGLIHANLLTLESRGALSGQIERLTWDGHEFLDSIRSDTVWARTKARLAAKGVGMSFELIKLTAGAIIKKLLD